MSTHEHAVLVVEDDPDSLTAWEIILKLSGFRVCTALSGADALAKLGGVSCCAIILDWWLSDMSGEEFLAQLQTDAALSCIPVLVYTGDARARTLAVRCGVRHVFLKPVDPEAITAALSGHCPRAE